MENKNIILRTENLSKHFGAVKAVQDVTLDIVEGTSHAVIGPNGAGKTTYMDLITNRTHPSSGKVFFRGEDITGMKPHKIAAKGICKSFQITQFFPMLTCYENIRVPLIQKAKQTFNVFPMKKDYLLEESRDILKKIGMEDLLFERAADLSYGDKKRLEIGIVLALKPSVLMLDEPAAGVARSEGYAIMDMIMRLKEEEHLTVVFIEHDMDIVFNYSDAISVMQHGSLVATDTPLMIRENPFVKKAYLGEES